MDLKTVVFSVWYTVLSNVLDCMAGMDLMYMYPVDLKFSDFAEGIDYMDMGRECSCIFIFTGSF